MLIDGCYNIACRHMQAPFYICLHSVEIFNIRLQPFRWNPDRLLLFWIPVWRTVHFLSNWWTEKRDTERQNSNQQWLWLWIIATGVYLQLRHYNNRGNLGSGWKKHPRSDSLSPDSTCILSNFCDYQMYNHALSSTEALQCAGMKSRIITERKLLLLHIMISKPYGNSQECNVVFIYWSNSNSQFTVTSSLLLTIAHGFTPQIIQ